MDRMAFERQLGFIIEVDRIKGIIRKSKLFDGSRLENDAEHSWTVCLMALILREHANAEVDLERVIKMLLLHDIPELDAGDTFLYSAERAGALEREEVAASRIFGTLGAEQGAELLALWREFEARQTPEAKFASVLDRLEPLLQNWKNGGYVWKEHSIKKAQVLERNRHIAEGSAEIWDWVQAMLDECVEKGWLED